MKYILYTIFLITLVSCKPGRIQKKYFVEEFKICNEDDDDCKNYDHYEATLINSSSDKAFLFVLSVEKKLIHTSIPYGFDELSAKEKELYRLYVQKLNDKKITTSTEKIKLLPGETKYIGKNIIYETIDFNIDQWRREGSVSSMLIPNAIYELNFNIVGYLEQKE